MERRCGNHKKPILEVEAKNNMTWEAMIKGNLKGTERKAI